MRANIECGYGLTIHLKYKRILTEEQYNTLDGMKSDRFAQNAALLEMLSEHTDVRRYKEFLRELRAKHQSHVLNCITAEGSMCC